MGKLRQENYVFKLRCNILCLQKVKHGSDYVEFWQLSWYVYINLTIRVKFKKYKEASNKKHSAFFYLVFLLYAFFSFS